MREAIGGSLLLYLVSIFIIIFIFFMGFAVKYAVAYRANNYVISKVEQNNGNINIESVEVKRDVLNTYNYSIDESGNDGKNMNECCVDTNNGAYFVVTTYVKFEVPLLTANIRLPITNHTRTLYGVSCDMVKNGTNINANWTDTNDDGNWTKKYCN